MTPFPCPFPFFCQSAAAAGQKFRDWSMSLSVTQSVSPSVLNIASFLGPQTNQSKLEVETQNKCKKKKREETEGDGHGEGDGVKCNSLRIDCALDYDKWNVNKHPCPSPSPSLGLGLSLVRGSLGASCAACTRIVAAVLVLVLHSVAHWFLLSTLIQSTARNIILNCTF